MEHWADDVLASLETKRLVSAEASAGLTLRPGHSHDEEEHEGAEEHAEEEEHDRGQFDPHVWLSPVNAKKEMENIKNAYVKADPDNKDYYEDNYKTYAVRFDELDQEYKDTLSALPGKSIVVSHEAFGYLCDTYGLTQMGIAGLSPDTEPDPARMAEIIDFVKTNHVKVIFFEELVSPKVAETIAAETGARTRVLNPLEGLSDEELKNGADYFTVMEDNLKQLKRRLNKNRNRSTEDGCRCSERTGFFLWKYPDIKEHQFYHPRGPVCGPAGAKRGRKKHPVKAHAGGTSVKWTKGQN